MSKDKQIDEMAELERLLRIRRMDIDKQGYDIWALIKKTESEEQSIADYLIGQGYRRASDVALEVIGEVVSKAKAIFCPDCDYDVADIRYNLDWLEAELKKKYTEGKG